MSIHVKTVQTVPPFTPARLQPFSTILKHPTSPFLLAKVREMFSYFDHRTFEAEATLLFYCRCLSRFVYLRPFLLQNSLYLLESFLYPTIAEHMSILLNAVAALGFLIS